MSAPLFHWLAHREAGVLLHPSCFPGSQGIGTFDRQADRFLDFLQAAGLRTWQICPLGPTGYGDSPYQCFSAFAGNPYLIDLQALAERGWLTAAELAPLAQLSADRVDFGGLYRLKWPLLQQAYQRYRRNKTPPLGDESFAAFKARQAAWLDPYAYFSALKDHHGGRAWTEWPAETRQYASALASPLRAKLEPAADAHRFFQYVFATQWSRVRAAAAQRGIAIIGDIPIFAAGDSADVWSRPELFEVDPATGQPTAVAGVPPDYFSADGQLWGNPLYAWKRHAADDFAWWRARLAAAFEACDIVRIDHFRGFDEYWRIPLPAENARVGKWMPGPGLALFQSIQRAFPTAKIIAEDLGVLTPGVVALRDTAGLPGMAVLQFAFGDTAENLYLPHNGLPNSVVYSGTHDNDTSLGWYASAGDKARNHARRYLRVTGSEIGWDFIRAAYASVSRLAIVPLQDILSLGSEARFNFPGHPMGNWQWRYGAAELDALFGDTAAYLRGLGELYGRGAGAAAPAEPAPEK
jgi:4-alpha-glucanotransferase